MIPSGGLAYAHARARAWKSRLLTRADAAPLLVATDAASVQRARSLLRTADRAALYRTVIRSYRGGAPLLAALQGLREIEEVKLAWRKERRRTDIAERYAGTPYAAITAAVARAHGADLAAAELAFDRWASLRLLDAARALPKRESLARELAENVVQERDLEIIQRGQKWYGLSEPAARAQAVWKADTRSERRSALHTIEELRRERLVLCRRAFLASPFLLAPAVALLLLVEEEDRALTALTEREGDASLDAPLLRSMAASLLGAG